MVAIVNNQILSLDKCCIESCCTDRCCIDKCCTDRCWMDKCCMDKWCMVKWYKLSWYLRLSHAILGLAKIYLFCQKITALPSWVSMGVCELKMINFKFFWLMATALSWLTKWLWPLYKWKKNWLDYSVHGIQNDRLGLTVATQKSVWKNLHRVPRYLSKCVKFWWFGLEGRFLTLFC